MAKKLKVEVDVETERAKRKLQGDLGGAIESQSGVAPASDKAQKSIEKLGKSADEAQVNMRSAAKAFSGLALGLATTYAAKHMEQGAARTSVEYGASALSGASMGAMVAGPWGAALGGAMGLAKTYLDKSAEAEDQEKRWAEEEKAYKAAREWAKDLEALTKAGNLDDIKLRAGALRGAESNIVGQVNEAIKSGQYDRADELKKELADTRSRANQLETLAKAIEKIPAQREGTDGPDALSKIGGIGFVGGQDAYVHKITKGLDDAVNLLTSIRENTGKDGGSVWR